MVHSFSAGRSRTRRASTSKRLTRAGSHLPRLPRLPRLWRLLPRQRARSATQKKRSPARMRSCAAECGRQGSTNMWACCESVDEGNVCQGLKAPDRLELGACLQARGGGDEGNSLQSDGGGWELRMQGDGNLAVYGNGGVVGDTEIKWASGSSGGNPLVCMQSDGNLVVYTACPANFQKCKGFYPLCGHGKGNYSVMQPDGNLVLYNKKGDGRTAVWATNDLNWEPGQQGR
ncbi:unnamed protein product [Polarella glacialis]|uniref:Bulb-type lectin domain-containing protein n=1 Tax=Polarella glacialis TaxID=89957 RepID=A0A813FDW1_POLGL|nr:unnamed protein product [Polarella glacialis]